jgi:electron transfer flavoprotein alpha subunit
MVVVYSDNKKLAVELLNKAGELAREVNTQVIAVHIGVLDDAEAQELIQYGADKVVIAERDSTTFKAEEYTDILEVVISGYTGETVLIGSTKNGKELAPRLASKLNAGCVSDCTNIYRKDGKFTVERGIYSGNAIAVQQFTSIPQIVTVPFRTFDPLPKDTSRSGEVIRESYTTGAYPSNIVKIQEMKSESVNIEEANIIVSCGRGFKKKDDIKLFDELLEVLKGGTVIGCSRPIAADLKWLSEDHWVGLSGHKVKPKVYIACGISGQIQHIAGMRESSIIVAINKDSEAPIFKSADYGIVGDLYTIIPALTRAIREKIKA